MAMIDDQETLHIFLEDAREHLSGIENDLLAIEAAGAAMDVGLVNKVFRAVHSIKGGAGFLGLSAIKELSHAMENLLNLMRNGAVLPTPAIISSLLAAADVLTGLVHDPMTSDTVDISPHVTALENALAAPAALPAESSPPPPAEETLDITLPNGQMICTVTVAEVEQARKGGKQVYLLELDLLAMAKQGKTPLAIIQELQAIGCVITSTIDTMGDLSALESLPALLGYVLFATLLDPDMLCEVLQLAPEHVRRLVNGQLQNLPARAAAPPKPAAPTAPVMATTPLPVSGPLPPASEPALPVSESIPAVAPARIVPAHDTSVPVAAPPRPAQEDVALSKLARGVRGPSPESSLRVHVKLLDRLMTLAGELVLARNQLVRAVASDDAPAVDATSQRVGLITSELQEAIMSTRMQPLGTVFHKFHRMVRDLSKDLGKDINLIIEGEEVELDKAVIEAIGDPLTHLVRNGADHGIETPDVRLQAGKLPQATLKLSARHEAGQVIIEVSDDGAGIDPRKVKDKAATLGLYDRHRLEAMSDKELVKLIFLPGFSTAKQVTDISGRGVGLDVVHTNLTKLGGAIDVDSQVGRGTTFRIKIPLTLAIIPCLLVTAAQERYAIPQVNLVEMVRISANQVAERIERIGSAWVMRRRGNLLPLIRLGTVLGCTPPDDVLPQGAVNIAVVTAGDLHYGLLVDSLLDSEEIVVKPLGQHLQGCKIYAGATILGDGCVALILDVMGVRSMMRLAEVQDVTKAHSQQAAQQTQRRQDVQTLLLVKNAPHEQFAIPLSLVSRIEKIAASAIEYSGGRRHMQYRGGTLRLLALEEVAQVAPRAEAETLFVIVFAVAGREVGLVVSSIVDVVETEVAFDHITFRQPGILGSAVLMGRTTLLVDLFGLVAAALPEWMVKPTAAALSAATQPTLLIVEDSHFFLQHLKTFIEEAGYRVVTAMDGVQALAALEQYSDAIKLVLTDIEMPNMDGLELTQHIRNHPRFGSLPVIAVTAVAGEAAAKCGLAVGIDEYLIKLDQEKVLSRVAHYLTHGRAPRRRAA